MEHTPSRRFFRRCRPGFAWAARILKTGDGFYLAYRSVSGLLAEKGIVDFLDGDGTRHACDRFF